jgi:predicted DNA-binding transcriptional regulator YafY
MIDHILKASLENNMVITIIYQKGSEITKRNIRVLKITDDSIEAYCYLRHQVRRFKRSSILSAAFIDDK